MINSRGFRVIGIVTLLIVTDFVSIDATAQRRRPSTKHLTVCGNPNVSCPSAATFEPYDLSFRMPQNAVIFDTELFYAIVLKSVSTRGNNCDNYIAEADRLAGQALFPDHKVFTSRCPDPGHLSYSNIAREVNFMAVYAGHTPGEANRMLATVKATGKFPGANIRRMRAMINGT